MNRIVLVIRYSVSLIILIGSYSCVFSPQNVIVKDPPSTQSPPIFPGAQSVSTQSISSGEAVPVQLITFETAEKPESVIAFYRDVLAKDGWYIVEILSRPSENNLRFRWDITTEYNLDVVATPGSNGLTEVVLRLATQAPE